MFPAENARFAELERCAKIAEEAGVKADREAESAPSERLRLLALGESIAAWQIAASIRGKS